ncbi:hypothetical protein KKG51_00300, partial [Patescibacteria group bacterium]|nr:hypothetical protein [Patescibacteria group bacterium]
MNKSCKNCGQKFEITDKDLKFYEQIDVPEPTCCPDCRQVRRLVWRNERSLYNHKCARTGKNVISYISPDKKQVVYSLDEWYKDDWDRLATGRDFDFNRPFFEQFRELMQETPHIALLIGDCENCQYTNFSWKNKNCYLISASDFNEDCMYSSYLFSSRDSVDNLFVNKSELAYECVDCERLYDSDHCKQCKDSRNMYYCEECVGCSNCIGCINLKKAEHQIFNEQLSKEEYEAQKEHLLKKPEKIRERFNELRLKEPIRYASISKSENCTGDYIVNCKNCDSCFDAIESEDCKYGSYVWHSKDCMDVNGVNLAELNYEIAGAPDTYNLRFCGSCWVKSNFLTYCYLCRACQNCFGCVSLHRNKYCILNKQYTKEEYEEIVPRIIEHMKKTPAGSSTGEW